MRKGSVRIVGRYQRERNNHKLELAEDDLVEGGG